MVTTANTRIGLKKATPAIMNGSGGKGSSDADKKDKMSRPASP